MNESDLVPLEAALAALRRALASDTAEVAVPRKHAEAIAGELPRVLQSAKRLRKQNAKLRRRIERLKAGLPDEPGHGDDADD
ncbi:MAG TPA: hypothetical protein VK081_11950 [Planctomycetota bacterium]|nr:hypothetical protein [Planctomycetota bacterium]